MLKYQKLRLINPLTHPHHFSNRSARGCYIYINLYTCNISRLICKLLALPLVPPFQGASILLVGFVLASIE